MASWHSPGFPQQGLVNRGRGGAVLGLGAECSALPRPGLPWAGLELGLLWLGLGLMDLGWLWLDSWIWLGLDWLWLWLGFSTLACFY